MLDPRHPGTSLFLWIAGGAFLVVYTLPLLVAPLTWARWFRWRLPAETPLTVYFGRCLGGLGTACALILLRAAPAPAAHRLVFELAILVTAIMCALHVWGAIEKSQPWTETAEIGLYGGLAVALVVMYRGLFY